MNNQFEDFRFGGAPQAIEQELFDIADVEVSNRIVTICAINLRKDRGKFNPMSFKTTPDARLSIRSYVDLETGRTNGIPIAKNPDGTHKFKQIVIDGMQAYDLSNRAQAFEYYVVSRHFEIENSVNQKKAGTKARFYIEDAEKQARENIERDRITSEIKEWIRQMADSEMLSLARTVIEGVDDMSLIVVKDKLLKKVESDYKLMYDRKTNVIRTNSMKLLGRAQVLGLIRQEVNGFKGYDGVDIGGSQGAACDFLTANKQYAITLEARCREEEVGAEKKKKKKLEDAEKLKASLKAQSEAQSKNKKGPKKPEPTNTAKKPEEETDEGGEDLSLLGDQSPIKPIEDLVKEVTAGSSTPGEGFDINLFDK
jgi:hypothetical protein